MINTLDCILYYTILLCYNILYPAPGEVRAPRPAGGDGERAPAHVGGGPCMRTILHYTILCYTTLYYLIKCYTIPLYVIMSNTYYTIIYYLYYTNYTTLHHTTLHYTRL